MYIFAIRKVIHSKDHHKSCSPIGRPHPAPCYMTSIFLLACIGEVRAKYHSNIDLLMV